MSDTPETDAVWQGGDTTKQVMTSRRLERERDEAKNRMADALQELDLRTLDFERMRAERDEARQECDNLKQELEIVTARLHGKKHPLDNGIPERHEVYIWKNGKYELDP